VEGRVKCLLRTEAGDIGFNKALALENAKGGITVNAICPGATSYRNGAGGKEILQKSILPLIPVNRLGEPEEIAAPWCFLPPTRRAPSPAPRCRSTMGNI